LKCLSSLFYADFQFITKQNQFVNLSGKSTENFWNNLACKTPLMPYFSYIHHHVYFAKYTFILFMYFLRYIFDLYLYFRKNIY